MYMTSVLVGFTSTLKVLRLVLKMNSYFKIYNKNIITIFRIAID